MARHTFFATCAPGLESLLYEEVRALKLGRAEQQVGGVRFEGELRDGCRANLWLRTAIRVLLRLERFEVYDGDALYKVVARHDWSRFLRPDGSLWVQAQSRESSLDHTRFIAQRVKDAIVDQLRTEDGVRPSVERENADLGPRPHLEGPCDPVRGYIGRVPASKGLASGSGAGAAPRDHGRSDGARLGLGPAGSPDRSLLREWHDPCLLYTSDAADE